MPNVISCPSERDLQELLLGQISDAQAVPLEEHLGQCDRCLQAASMLNGEDTLAEAVRTQAATPEMPTGEIVEGLMQRLENLRPALAAAAQMAAGTIAVEATPSEEGIVAVPSPAGPAPTAASAAATQVIYDFLAPAEVPEELGRLGPYRILKILGAGGMGVVFQAEDPHLGRHVALKALLPALASSASARQRFVREAKAVAAIEHDHIVTIHQVGEEGGVPFLAMPLLKGESLEERLKRQPKLTVPQVLQIGREIAEGLAAAHARGLMHRDIKPANLWLEAKEGETMNDTAATLPNASFKRVKILDFGLARAAGDATQITQSGAIVGTPAYMAPEQTRAGGVVDHRVDLFSLGCVLYRMLTGELPFKGNDTMSILAALALDTPPTPREIDPQVPVALSDLVMELLAKKPADRPASAQAVVSRIQAMEQALVVGETVPPRPTNRIPPLFPHKSRGRRWFAVAAAVLVGALALGAIQFGPAVYRFAMNQGQLIIESKDADVEVIVTQGGQKIKILDVKTRQEVTLDAGTYQVEIPGAHQPSWNLSTRQFTLERGGREIVKVTFVPGPGEDATKKSDPRQRPFAEDLNKGRGTAAKAEAIHRFGPDDRPLTRDGVTAEAERWRNVPKGPKDGQIHGYLEVREPQEWRIDAKAPRTVRLFEIPNPGVEDCMVIYRASMKSADLKGRAYPEMLCRFPGIGEAFSKGFDSAVEGTTDWVSCQTPFFLKKGERPDLIKLNVVIEGKGTVWIKNVELLRTPLPVLDEKRHTAAEQPGGRPSGPSSKRLLGGDDGDPNLLPRAPLLRGDKQHLDEIRLPAKLRTFKGHQGDVTGVRFSPDGKRAVSSGKDGMIRSWDVQSGREVWQAETGEALAIDVSGDGRRVLAGIRSVKDFAGALLLDAASGKILRRFPMGETWCMSVAFPAESCRALVVGLRNTFVLWDTETGEELQRFVSPGRVVTCVAVSPDGRWAVSGSDQENVMRLWNVSRPTDQSGFEEEHHGAIKSVTFSPDGRQVLSASADGTVRLWRVSNGRQVRVFQGHAGSVNSVAFAPDGRRALSAGDDGTVRLWDLETGKQLASLKGSAGAIKSVAYSPDGRSALSGGAAGCLYLWQVPAAESRDKD